LGAKDIVLKLVDHSNEELSRHALTAVSKMMVQNWAVRGPIALSFMYFDALILMSLFYYPGCSLKL
jgi:hypothetical protein